MIAQHALTGDDLTIDDVWAVAVGGARAVLSDSARAQMHAASEVVDRAAHGRSEHTYGVNTGFGRFVSQSIPEELTQELQLRLLRSHACGVGEPYPDEIVRAAMLLRANALAKGRSGARVGARRAPARVPRPAASCRSCRAAARSAPAATWRRSRISRCRSSGRGRRGSTGSACRAGTRSSGPGSQPMALEAKEGLSLVNGTQFMAAFGALGLVRARRLAKAADIACAVSLEALQGSRVGVHSRRCTRCGRCVGRGRRRRTSSRCSRARRSTSRTAGATRCRTRTRSAARRRCTAPRATCFDYIDYTVSVELNAATDNPLVLVEDDMLVSNGNFHGQPLAFALDALAMAVAELANISERRVERLVNPSLSGGLPPFLTTDGGLNSGFMIPQYVAASLVSENKVLAHPASVDSIPTSAGQEDHVSMGNAAGLKAWQVLANAEWALAIELLAGVQGVEFLAPLEPGRGVGRGARLRTRALAAADRRPAARRRHRRGRGRDPRRVARRGGRGRDAGRCGEHATGRRSRATVEALAATSSVDPGSARARSCNAPVVVRPRRRCGCC